MPMAAPEPRRVTAARALQWLVQALNVGARNARALFGGAGLGLACLYLLLVAVLAVLGPNAEPAKQTIDARAFFRAAAPVYLLMLLTFPLLLGGVVHLIDRVERGEPVRALDVFAPLRDAQRAGALIAVGLLQAAISSLTLVVVMLLTGDDFWTNYLRAIQEMVNGRVGTPPQPRHPVLLALVQLTYNYTIVITTLLSVPLVVCSGLGISGAFLGSLRAAARNLVPNLVAAAIVIAAVFAAGFAFLLVTAVAAQVGALIHAGIGAFIAAALTFVFATVLITLLMAAAYFAWRDMFGAPDADAMPPPTTHIAA